MLNLLRTTLVLGLIGGIAFHPSPTQADEYPQHNAWYQAAPSVVWCGDETSTTTLEVHIEGRNDVARVWLTDLGTDEEEGRAELFDDGTNGDQTAGDNVFTLSDVAIPCKVNQFFEFGWKLHWMFLRVELDDGTQIGNNYGLTIGMVDPIYKDSFEVAELAPGITATQYALFIDDTQHEVFNDYPVADVYCGKSNFAAFQKLEQPFGMLFFLLGGFLENVSDLNVTFFFGLAGKIGVAVSGLGFACKCRQNVLLGL